MARTPDGAIAKRHMLHVRIDDIEDRIIEKRRGKRSASQYIRELIREDGRRRKERPVAEPEW